MRWLRSAAAELLGLFVDDGRYALAIVVWLALAWLALPRLRLDPRWNTVLLTVGLLVILVAGTLRGARQKRD